MRWIGSGAVIVPLLGLFVASIVIGGRLESDISHLQATLRGSAAPAPAPLRGAVVMVNGIDQRGKVVDRMPAGTRRMVIFVVSEPRIREKLGFWRKVRATAPAGTFLLGVCGDAACVLQARNVPASVPIEVESEVAGLAIAINAGRTGKFLVTDNRARILDAPPIRPRPEAVVAEIQAVR